MYILKQVTTLCAPLRFDKLVCRLWLLTIYSGVIYVSPLYLLVFNQGEEGTSWYIIQKGSVNVVIYGKVSVCMNAFVLLHAYVSFCDNWALFNCSASSDAISCVTKGLKCAADRLCMEQTSIVCPVGLGNTSGGVWQTLLSSPWLITMIKWLKGIVRIHNFTPHVDLQPLYRQMNSTWSCAVLHIDLMWTYTHALCTHTDEYGWFTRPERWFFFSRLRMTSKLFVSDFMFIYAPIHASVCVCVCVCVCVLGCRVHAPWGWWLWEVGPGYRFTSCSLHRPERR